MLSTFLRVVFTLTGAAPLLISVAYVLGEKGSYRYAVIAALSCVVLGGLSVVIIRVASARLESFPAAIKKAKSADKEVVGFYVAYALPLLFKDSSLTDPGTLLVSGALLCLVLWATKAFQVNPVLGLFGYNFYEAEMEDGMTYLLVTRKKLSHIRAVKNVAQLSEYGLLDVTDRD